MDFVEDLKLAVMSVQMLYLVQDRVQTCCLQIEAQEDYLGLFRVGQALLLTLLQL